MRSKNILGILSLFCSIAAHAEVDTAAFNDQINSVLQSHFQKYQKLEYFSGITLSIYTPSQPIQNFYVGRVSHQAKSAPINADTLFQIGSITKSFTAAIVLQLEKEGKLTLDNSLKDFLPQYEKWGTIKIESLLNMTSGLPNYSDTPLWNAEEYQNPTRIWTNEELINFVYPPEMFSPPIKEGYFYTNTGYILADLIIQKITQHTFEEELINRTFKPAQLSNTFYSNTLPQNVQQRIAQGYNYNQYDNPYLLGKNLSNNNLSWAAAAGGIVSNSEDIIKWVQALFIDETVLDTIQKSKLTRLVSLTTGKPLGKTSAADPKGFGLGVVQAYSSDKQMNYYWYYEGETLGFRALYMYVPCNGVIISSIFNSATNAENDHAGDLIKQTYALILKQYPLLQCQKYEIRQATYKKKRARRQHILV